MAVTCVDGQGQAPHITGADKGRLHAGIFGEKSVVLAVGKRLAATQESANRVTIATGDASLHGRQVSVTAPEQVTITSGTQGQNRNDFICLKYECNAQGIESAKLEVLRGVPTSGKAEDPLVPAGNVLNGDAQDYFPLYRVKLNGVVASKPEQLFIFANTLYQENINLEHWTTLQDDGACRVRYCIRGGMMYLDVYLAPGYSTYTTTPQMPDNLLPGINGYYPLGTQKENSTAKIWIGAAGAGDGHIYLYNYSSGYATGIIPILPKSME